MEKNEPLVSVNVLMYNSSKYILETLESIKAQTYQNIELIMSDDKSTDNTIQICEKWIAQNKDRFTSYQILVPDHNTGQSGNYNRAFRAATGEWIKEIDGDDLLTPESLTCLISYAQEHPNAKYIFGDMSYFYDTIKKKKIKPFKTDTLFFSESINKQLELMLEGNRLSSPTSFYNREFIQNINFENDERIPNMEDWPKWISLLDKGVKFYHCNKPVALYRVGSGISTQKRDSLRYYRSLELFDLFYRYPRMAQQDPIKAANWMADRHCKIYADLLQAESQINTIKSNSGLHIISKIRHFFKCMHH